MSYQVLARKWRPKSFATLVGQEHVVRALTHALEQNRLHHAYLFTGTRGVGKTTLARIMAKALNCEAGVGSTPCGVCSACTAIDTGRFVDYIELDAASNRGVDDMTALLERATYAPTIGRYKVYVIDEVHQLSGHAFNAMLKTLEEPPEHVKFILATTDPQKIPVTVLSRCLQFNLKQMPLTHIVEHLSRVLEAEGVAFEPAALRHLAKGAAGSMRDALSLLDQAIAHGAGKVEDEGVRAMLGTVGDEHLFALLDGLVAQDVHAMTEVAKLMDARSLSFDGGLQELATLFHRIALIQFAPEALLDDTERTRLAPYAQALDAEYLQLAYQIAIHGRDELSLAPDDYAGFVMTLLRLHAFRPDRGGAARVATRPAVPAPVRPAPPAAATAAPARPVAAVAPAPTPAPSAAPVTSAATVSATADEDWHALLARLPLTGMAKQLAQHCELSERSETAIRLRLAPLHKHLLGKPQQDKLQAELQLAYGRPLRLEIDVAEPASETPAERSRNAQRERQDRAVASIEQDPFVRDVVDLFDASIDESTIKPV
ncbi:DNA polymerase III subunit gamma/tau [Sulfuritalea hydrogenivorans]|jgi:DNA polymerase-3 subunit gamma/tau|uniref:DNA polymerase III subunit gamma/tau n=1 Tax=Sulfuritalea hydrogenivorans sk43H TaxID=1223802 RepID=W0SGM8_9PROT|nr:DNA polymerase III subunit gamma/tau [Sulfuritalea hydrogenivorans]BAO29910.1 DNA polymerase III, subunit gamma/tau [Sulfuritalea hydrogenivorans sk43H]